MILEAVSDSPNSRDACEAADKGPCERKLNLELGTQNFVMTTIGTLALPSHCLLAFILSPWVRRCGF